MILPSPVQFMLDSNQRNMFFAWSNFRQSVRMTNSIGKFVNCVLSYQYELTHLTWVRPDDWC